ncbi:MAG: superoxide dismutase family protein [Gammaproteobacteria bacterium]|nr:superoxide dismutase family protein [Gammaproteobacteria bacterium]
MVGAVWLSGCSFMSPTDSTAPVATAILKPTANNTATGTITFTQVENKVHIEGNIAGLSPGPHGFHIHEKGDCSAADGASAGGHFNPTNKAHGANSGTERHAGDLGNLVADSDGKAVVKIEIDGVTTTPGEANSIVGRGLIVHADADDFKTQPTGNSGKRVACGAIDAAVKS